MENDLPDFAGQPTQRRIPSGDGKLRCDVVVVTYQSAKYIGALLDTLESERATGIDLDVIVVDNASSDATSAVVARFPNVRFLQTGANLGYAAAINIASDLSATDHALLILNPDLRLEPGALLSMLTTLEDPEVGLVVPQIRDLDGALYPSLHNEPSVFRAFIDGVLGQYARLLPQRWSGTVWRTDAYDAEQRPDWATGAALLVAPRCRQAVGRWDERYFLFSEETDYMRRVRGSGFHLRYQPAAIVHHVGGGSGVNKEIFGLFTMNSVRYYRKYHRPQTSVAFAAVVALQQVLRIWRPEARYALLALLSPTVRSRLPGRKREDTVKGPDRG